ncbi:MAG TPA: hypothetical protein VIK91_13790, partial [Nannocystis sp.]
LAVLTGRDDLDPVHARGVVRRVGDHYDLRLDVRTPRLRQRKALRADSCATLADAAALLIAIALDPLEVATQLNIEPAPRFARPLDPDLPLAVEPRETAPEPVPAPDPTPRAKTPTPTPVRPAEPPPPEPPDTTLLVRVEGALDAGTFQTRPMGDLAGLVGVLHRRLRAELHGMYTLPRALENRATGQKGTIARWALGVRLCGRFVRSVFEIALCGGLEGGLFVGRGQNVRIVAKQDPETPLAQRAPEWFAALLGLGFVWSPHPRVGLGVRTEFVLAPLQRSIFVGDHPPSDDDIPPADRIGLMGIRVSGGLELRFGPGARRDGKAATRPRSR